VLVTLVSDKRTHPDISYLTFVTPISGTFCVEKGIGKRRVGVNIKEGKEREERRVK